MSSFENLKLVVVANPTTKEVLDRICRDEPCQADPSSPHCTWASAKDDYLLGDVAASKICRDCPTFERLRQRLLADWEEWALAMQEVYT